MKAVSLFVAAVVVAGANTSASAQWTGTRLGPRPAETSHSTTNDKDAARLAMRSFVRCAINASRSRVLSYLETFPGSREADKGVNFLSRNDCLAFDEIQFNELLFRWAAYDELYNEHYSGFELEKISSVPSPDYAGIAAARDADPLQIIAIWKMGECSVRAAPREANELVKSVIGSSAESTAIKAMVPFISGCINEGNNIEFSKGVLRGIMAESLYKIAQKSGGAQPEQGAN